LTLPRLLALDWGTSVLRAYLLGESGAVLEERRKPWGIMHLPEGGFAGALEGIAGDWRAVAPDLSVIACGMVVSAQGLREAPYTPCPAGEEALASALLAVEVTPRWRMHIVPGVRRDGERPDVMRGEETQVIGVLARAPQLAVRALLVMPGTHSKWVQVHDGRIVDFQTYMTGELFAVLSEHSILGRPARSAPTGEGSGADEAFERGVSAILKAEGIRVTALLFSVRTLVLTGQLKAEHSLEYLSGLLVGDELRCALIARDEARPLSVPPHPLTLVGDATLCARYRRAMAVFGLDAAPLIEDAAPNGLWRIARRAGLCAAA
jgi:2-dehydro-3-deoxygalactonokinase